MATGKATADQRRDLGSLIPGRQAARRPPFATRLCGWAGLASLALLGACTTTTGVLPPAETPVKVESAPTESVPPSRSTHTPASKPAEPRPAVPRALATSGGLAGSSWYWLGTLTPNGAITPADPGNYTLEFLEGGSLAIQLDCNRGTASWLQTGSRLSIGKIASTRMACPAGSEGQRLARHLQAVNAAQRLDGVLELSGAQGSLILSRDPDWRLASYDCRSGQSIVVVFSQDRALVRWGGAQYPMTRLPGNIERYSSPGASLFRYGPEATLVVDGRQVAGPCPAKRLGL